MKKIMLTAVIAVLAVFGISSAASATITSPGTGGALRASGSLTLAGAIVRSTCTTSLSGTVSSGTTASISSASATGCTTGTLALDTSTPWTLTLNLAGTFAISGVRATLSATVPIFGTITCIYNGGLSGTYTTGASSRLTLTGDSLVRQSGSSSACTTDPTVSGTFTSNATTT